MWLTGAWAAAEVPASGGSDQLILAVSAVIGTALTVLGGVLVALINKRPDRTTPSPPPPENSAAADAWRETAKGMAEDITFLRERVAVHGQRLDDHDETLDILDRRQDATERAKDRHHPGWRDT